VAWADLWVRWLPRVSSYSEYAYLLVDYMGVECLFNCLDSENFDYDALMSRFLTRRVSSQSMDWLMQSWIISGSSVPIYAGRGAVLTMIYQNFRLLSELT
jgi:hypothetical protein